MSDVINGVPRELLERISSVMDRLDTLPEPFAEAAELRALLTAQPQASAAQSAPAGEREAFEAHMRIGGYSNTDKHPDDSYVSSAMELWWQGWKARAAWQRTQSALGGSVERMHFEYQHPDSGEKRTVTIARQDVTDGMEDTLFEKLCEQICRCEPVGETNVVECNCSDYTDDFRLLAAAPAQPAAQGEFGDAYQGAREDLAIWKRRALEAEAKVRHQDQIIDHLTLEAQGESRMGEPFIPAAQDQGEVQRLREALEGMLEYFPEGESDGECFAVDAARAALAASAGQEV